MKNSKSAQIAFPVPTKIAEAFQNAPLETQNVILLILNLWLKNSETEELLPYLPKILRRHQDRLETTLNRISGQYKDLLQMFTDIDGLMKDQEDQKQEFRIDLIKKSKIFQELNFFDLLQISYQMEELTVETGTDLLTQGEPSDGVFFVQKGTADVVVNDERVSRRNEGDCFGEMSCLTGEENASATVKASSPAEILKVDRQSFLKIVNRTPQLWKNLFLEMTQRLKHINHRLVEIMQHIPQGFVKVDQEGIITSEFSMQCTRFFGIKELAGVPFHELVFPNNTDSQFIWKSTYPLLFTRGKMDSHEISLLLPQETDVVLPGEITKHYLFSYYPCHDRNNTVVAIDVGIEDVTNQRALSIKSNALEKEKTSLRMVYDQPDAFVDFLKLVREAKTNLDYFGKLLVNFDLRQSPEVIDEMMRTLHTLKGASGMFALEELQKITHDLETVIFEFKSDPKGIEYYSPQFAEKKIEFDQRCEYAESLVNNMSQELRERLFGIVLSKDTYQRLKKAAENDDLNQVKEQIFALDQVPIKKLLHNWPKEVHRLSHKLGKQVRLEIHGGDVIISTQVYNELNGPLNHILRNCLDHGIESVEKRHSLGKDETGVISVTCQKKSGKVKLSISDDGQGLDIKKILEKARSNPKLSQKRIQSYINQDDFWKILFLPGFSTTDLVTEISGRGIGLNAVKKMMTSLKGRIWVKNTPGRGVQFLFLFPASKEAHK